jgi:hypothetical protein
MYVLSIQPTQILHQPPTVSRPTFNHTPATLFGQDNPSTDCYISLRLISVPLSTV